MLTLAGANILGKLYELHDLHYRVAKQLK